ncbi:nucleotidyl transferase AbiEii/AbiGii toxin family protein [Cellulomonas dongxiuzhuiae]|uniref:Nucleotidyl transferase AbiEii/AbiGii toxin family protein n=1 Tax=Cellulomonas dongxiuzhuiae TaxID=2819979 RepID=A0ABX8GMC4_9CELL|nr:nucleotidyl transferase AbiEii/AbiGii toxin family protein [Cellulomonas dongxiuzhuiae]MBO3095416.1 nucleotidyl transferase AbiEii/AbiGii toxin family protein [Cellulomonas dongxiuzhuiae]QWC16399.1 nucleotidyl transferase AbiEii/AbiGii toxin family protein [Cellulomonas dongxiuzhuiae]
MWDEDPRTAADTESIYLNAGEDVTIKFQLVDTANRASWPHEERAILQRYSDAPAAVLNVPTSPAAVAMKLSAWVDRRTPRDLYDLWAMSQAGMITADAIDVYRRWGQSGRPFESFVFSHPPTDSVWEDALGHQCRLRATPVEAIESVGRALDELRAIQGGYAPDHSPETAWLSRPQSRRSSVPVSGADLR